MYYATIVRTISLRLPDDLLARLESEAKARRATKSLLIREGLRKRPFMQPLEGMGESVTVGETDRVCQ